MNIPVLIIGAGPIRLTLACELARRDVPLRIIERSTEYPQGSRIKGLQPRSMEVFDDLGIINKILDAESTEVKFRTFNWAQLLNETPRENFPREDANISGGCCIVDESAIQLFGQATGLFVIRPDGYIGLVSGIGDIEQVNSYMSQFVREQVN